MSARSSSARVSVAPPIQPSTCSGERAPTIAPLTPGQRVTQATATAATVAPCRAAMGRRASRSDRLRLSSGSLNEGGRRRQSSAAMAATRAALNESVRMPDAMGL